MDSYTLEGISRQQQSSLCTLLDTMGYSAGMDGLYWLPLPDDELSPLQREHCADCGPYALALEIERGRLVLEFLIHARNSLCCDCICPAQAKTAERMQASLEALLTCAGIAPQVPTLGQPTAQRQ